MRKSAHNLLSIIILHVQSIYKLSLLQQKIILPPLKKLLSDYSKKLQKISCAERQKYP